MSEPQSRKDRFEALFGADPDPWDFETSSYEREKRAQTIAALSGQRFKTGLELGCATGVLTESLAAICDSLVGIDISERALSIAQERLRDRKNVLLRQGEVPLDWPRGSFDLIVFSEVLYFLCAAEIRTVSTFAHRALARNGICLLVNWTGPSDLALDGNEATSLFTGANDWKQDPATRAPHYRIDRLRRVPLR